MGLHITPSASRGRADQYRKRKTCSKEAWKLSARGKARAPAWVCRGVNLSDAILGQSRRESLCEDRVIDRPVWYHVAVSQVRGLRSGLFVLGFYGGEAVTLEIEHRLLRIDAVELGVVAAEDCGLNGTIGGPERFKTMLLLHR